MVAALNMRVALGSGGLAGLGAPSTLTGMAEVERRVGWEMGGALRRRIMFSSVSVCASEPRCTSYRTLWRWLVIKQGRPGCGVALFAPEIRIGTMALE